MLFVDWISVSQQHNPDTPAFLGSLTLRFDDDQSDVIVRQSAGARKVVGSHDTSLLVRSHQGRVTVSGNPSRWCRADNLFGLSLDDGMQVLNRELVNLGLPVFTQGHRGFGRDPGDHLQGKARWSGARFSRLDLTCNFAAGSELLAKAVVQTYAGRSVARLRRGHFGDETAAWVGSRRTVKAYRKGAEMRLHARASAWTEWAEEVGIVRHEVELKRRYLWDTGYCYWGNLDMGTLHRIFEEETAHLARHVEAAPAVDMENVPSRYRVAFAAWRAGQAPRALMSRSAFYRARAAILSATRCDIGDVATSSLISMPRRITLTQIAPPAGYSFEQERAA